jgi:hypothetical protein
MTFDPYVKIAYFVMKNECCYTFIFSILMPTLSGFRLSRFNNFHDLTPSQSAIANAPIIPFLIGSIASLID